MLVMISAIVSPVLSGKAARRLTCAVFFAVAVLSAVLLSYTCSTGESFVYFMGHFPAPWGNEIRAGVLEALMALFFSVIGLLSMLGGMGAVLDDIEPTKINLYCVLVDLIMSSLLAMTYTNDLFTAYVFIEINTIAGCGLIMIRQTGKTLVTATRYMVVSLLGSGLFLIGVVLTYTITGHLLMSNIKESVAVLSTTGEYEFVLIAIVGLMTVGIAIKSGLYPFHMWIPDAYGYSNVASSAMLSSIVSKGYIFLLIKIYYRVIGLEVIWKSSVVNVVFVFGIIAIIIGSIKAIREKSVRRIIAYSSVAQIGYIYMGLGLGTVEGVVASVFHILSHGATKSLLFIASSDYTEGSHTKTLDDIEGLAAKYRFSALTFSAGAFSMVGFPMLSGFISKLLFSTAAIDSPGSKTFAAVFALAISTILNAVYFLRMVIKLYSTTRKKPMATSDVITLHKPYLRFLHYFAVSGLVVLNFVLGLGSQGITALIESGLAMFG